MREVVSGYITLRLEGNSAVVILYSLAITLSSQMNEKQVDSLKTPVNQGSVVLHVIERIKEALINKELKAGDYLPSETELTKNLGVGKSSIREAIKMLQAMGVVEVRRGQGTIIQQNPGKHFIDSMFFQLILENGDPQDIIDLRIMFEMAYTLMAMKRAGEQDIERIREAHQKFTMAFEKGVQKVEDDLAFHHTILQSTHNPFVIWIGETILELFKTTMSRAMNSNPQRTLQSHEGILEAFCGKDEQKLRETLIKSFEQWKDSFLDKQETA